MHQRGSFVTTLLIVSLLVACGSAPSRDGLTGAGGIEPAALPSPALLGVYYGNQGWRMDQVQALEQWSGRKNAAVLLFTDWCSRNIKNLFAQQLPNIWNNRNVPIVTWEPFLCSGDSDDIEVRIARGEFDGYVTTWAEKLRSFLAGTDGIYGSSDDRRVYLRLAHEMNGDWYRWGAALGGNDPRDYVAMWAHVFDLVTNVVDPGGASGTPRASRLSWIWCVNHQDVGGRTAESFFPGRDRVDWIGIDGYNWGSSQTWSTWKSPAETFDPMLARVRSIAPDLPIALTEVASSSSGSATSGAGSKGGWVLDLTSYASSSGMRMVVWFDEDKETDWAVFGGSGGNGTVRIGRTSYRVYKEYPAAVANLTTSQIGNPRLLTDAQFVLGGP
ncbi:glycoside hydrolase family 26 protein [Deinococcus pimensis]|uniref:glycoside hydrolase family 26 protein n=1 Tax=Deinococcus pimensis TaxID=309888 RepID=UPI0004B85359|nr:glycosyl hydrolase [Deinococcus pimensis]